MFKINNITRKQMLIIWRIRKPGLYMNLHSHIFGPHLTNNSREISNILDTNRMSQENCYDRASSLRWNFLSYYFSLPINTWLMLSYNSRKYPTFWTHTFCPKRMAMIKSAAYRKSLIKFLLLNYFSLPINT